MDLSFYLSLFPAYVREMPRFMALAEALLRQVLDLAVLVNSINSGFSVGSATGVQLDALGESFSIPRQEGWDDETYRSVLQRKLKRFAWDGTNETSFDFLLSGETFRDNDNGTVTVGTGALPLPASELLPIPVGVKAELIHNS